MHGMLASFRRRHQRPTGAFSARMRFATARRKKNKKNDVSSVLIEALMKYALPLNVSVHRAFFIRSFNTIRTVLAKRTDKAVN